MTTRDLWSQVDIETPSVTLVWKKLSAEDRKRVVVEALANSSALQNLEISKCLNDGGIFFSEKSDIKTSERADLLLDLEEEVKRRVDPGLTVWIEPQKDKSALRRLRGVVVDTV